MEIVIIVGFFAVLFAFLDRKLKNDDGLKISIAIIFVFLALRYDYGNDYMNYLNMFNEINQYSAFNLSQFNMKGNEIGWVLLNRFFKPFGFFTMIVFLASFHSLVLYYFIKKYVSPSFYWFAIFIYIFEPHMMLVLSSAMRQAVSVSLFLIAINYLVQKKRIKYIIIIGIATLFHSSATFLFPFVLLTYINKKMGLKSISLIVIFILCVFIYLQPLRHYINDFINNYFKFYSVYLESSEGVSSIGLGFTLNIFILLYIIYNSVNETNFVNNIFYKIVIISTFIIPLSFIINIISRLNFYLITPSMIVLVPLILNKTKNEFERFVFLSIIISFTLYKFFMFFYSEIWQDKFLIYQTIFSS